MELDFSSLWSWTLPLWGLVVIIFYLGGVLTETIVVQRIPVSTSNGVKRVRFAPTADDSKFSAIQ